MDEDKKNVYAGTGISKDDDPFEAGREAAEMAVMKCGKDPNFGLVFASSKYNPQKLVDGVQSVFGKYEDMNWIGCTSSGEISNYGATTNSCVSIVISSKYMRVGIGIGENTNINPIQAGKTVGSKALESLEIDKQVDPYIQYLAMKKLPTSQAVKLRPYSMILLTPGFTIQKPSKDYEILQGLTEISGRYMPIVGGAASNIEMGDTYLFCNGKIYKDTAIVAAVMHDIKVEFSMKHGYKPTGKYVMVTKSKGNIVYELDGVPALEKYAELIGRSIDDIWPMKMEMQRFPTFINTMMKVASKLGKDVMELNPMAMTIAYNPFGVRDIHGDYWLKSPYHVIERKYLQFYEDIPQNTLLYIMAADEKDLIEASKNSFIEATQNIEPSAALFFECALRKWRLGKNTDKIVKDISNSANCPIIGFYSDGEFGAIRQETSNKHSITSVCMVFGKNLISER